MLQASQAIPEVPDDAISTDTSNDFQVQLWATSTSIWESGASWSNLLDLIDLEQSRPWSDSFAAKLHFGPSVGTVSFNPINSNYSRINLIKFNQFHLVQ